MRIIHRLGVAFGCILAIGIVQGALSFAGLRVLGGKAEHAAVNPLRQVDAARGIWDAYGDAKSDLTSTLNGVRFEASSEAISRFRKELAKIDAHLADLKAASPSAGMLERLRKAEGNIREWSAGALVLLGEKPALSIPAPHTMERLARALRTDLQDLVNLARADASLAAEDMRSQGKTIETLILMCVVLATLASAALAGMAAMSLTRPLVRVQARMRALMDGDIASAVLDKERSDEIGQIAHTVEFMKMKLVEREEMQRAAIVAAEQAQTERVRAERETIERERALVNASIGAAVEKLARKDLTFRLDATLPDAYGKLQSNFNEALSQLEDAMQEVSSRSTTITATTTEMSRATNDLSRRTEQQAASLEETAAALDEITATVKKTAENALHARDIANATRKSAETTSSVVGKTIDAMGEIEKSSQQINQIIGVIDEIAFQTNLLALNAGVEAARAGDSGRGFAVVASEVRALAQRSAQAAKEIKELILRSSSLVGGGVSLVAETGKSLDLIIRQVADINAAIVTIASGAEEQATGIQEVNTAINQMDQVTQQNAAMVEQTTAASSALAEETKHLQSGVAQFRVVGGKAHATAIAAPARAMSPGAAAKRPMRAVGLRSTQATALKEDPGTSRDEWEDF